MAERTYRKMVRTLSVNVSFYETGLARIRVSNYDQIDFDFVFGRGIVLFLHWECNIVFYKCSGYLNIWKKYWMINTMLKKE